MSDTTIEAQTNTAKEKGVSKSNNGIFHRLTQRIRYSLMKARFMRLPEKNRHRVSKDIYEIAYQALENNIGEESAACAVIFDCAYDSHIKHYIGKTLSSRCENEKSNTDYYAIEKLDTGTWCVVVIVSASNQDVARAAADASAMSAILSAPMTTGTFKRYTMLLEHYEKDADDTKEFVKEKILPLFSEYELATEIVEID